MSQPISGTDGRFQLNGVNLAFDEWTLDAEATDVETTNFESTNGCEEGITTTKVATFGGKAFFDGQQQPHANPPNIVVGATLSSIQLYVSRSLNLFYRIPLGRVLRLGTVNTVKSRVNFSFSGKTQGQWFYPGNIAA